MNLHNARFELTAVKPEQYPDNSLPEVAFVGRSNAGKSSLINAMLNRKNLARTAAKPGKTRTINFFNIDDTLYFVDLPGYGYASASKAEKSCWGKIIETYLCSRQQLRLIVMLVDIRHRPSEDDQLMHQWLVAKDMPLVIIAAKADKIKRGQIASRLKEIKETLRPSDTTKIIVFSSQTGQGRDELWREILLHTKSSHGKKI